MNGHSRWKKRNIYWNSVPNEEFLRHCQKGLKSIITNTASYSTLHNHPLTLGKYHQRIFQWPWKFSHQRYKWRERNHRHWSCCVYSQVQNLGVTSLLLKKLKLQLGESGIWYQVLMSDSECVPLKITSIRWSSKKTKPGNDSRAK